MSVLDSVRSAILYSLGGLWLTFIAFLPRFLGAAAVLILGLVAASALRTIVTKLVQIARVDQLLEGTGVSGKVKRAVGMSFSLSALIGWIVKWFVIIAALIAVADILGWEQVTAFLQSIALYIPHVVVAVIILIVGLLAGQFLHDVVMQAVISSRLPSSSAPMVAALAKWAVIIFAFMASVTQLGIATRLIETLLLGVVTALSLAFGLALGLGGKDVASRWLERVEREMRKE